MPTLFQKSNNQNNKIQIGIVIGIIVVIAAILLRFVQWIKPDTQFPLLTQSEGLVRLTSLDQLKTYSQIPLKTPNQTYEADLYVIGVYGAENSALPKGTVALVYTKNRHRFVEIDYRPTTTLEKELLIYRDRKKEQIVLAKDQTATLVRIQPYHACKEATAESIGVCQFTRALFFTLDDLTVSLFADGQQISDGELIQMARSIVDADVID